VDNHSAHIILAHTYWKEHLRPGDVAIDATCGNGRDTLMLAQILLECPDSLLIGLDIQPAALEKTALLLKKSLPDSYLSRVLLHRLCHAQIDSIPLPIQPRLIVYNLGYLPGSDKTITTQTPTTLQSLQKGALLLASDGAISITCYPGHPEGEKEELEILAWTQLLNPAKWLVCHHRWVNRSASPSLFWIRSTD
jgi:hypothetical protein